MCRHLLLLLLPAVAVAQDTFPQHLEQFEKARQSTLKPGGQALIYPAIDALVATGDVRAVAPLATFLRDTIADDRKLLADVQVKQQEAAAAHDRADVLAEEIKQLELKEKAGDRTVGPEIARRESERREHEREFEELRRELDQQCSKLDLLRALRGHLDDDCVTLLKGKTGEEATTGLASVRRALDVADKEQALFLVSIIGRSELPEAEEHLLEILAAPKADGSVRQRAESLLVKCLSRRGAETLLKLWERDPEGEGARAQHVLSVAAKKRLETIEDARAWAASLP